MARPNIEAVFSAIDKMSPVVKRMAKNVQTFGSRSQAAVSKISGAFNKLKGVMQAAMALYAGSIVVKAINDFATLGDEVAKTAKELDITVEGLQKMRFAMERQGGSADSVDKAFSDMNKTLGKMQAGTGRLSTLLDKTNPQLKQQLLTAKTSEERFKLLTNAIATETDTTKKAALADAAFGSSKRDILKLTEDGTDAMEALYKESERYGLITEESAKASEAYKDAVTNLTAASKGLLYTAMGPIIQQLTPLLQKMADWIAANRELISTRVNQFLSVVIELGKTFVSLWEAGVIQVVLAAVAAWKAYVWIMAIWAARAKVMIAIQTIQTALTWAMSTPILLIILAVLALIAIFYLLYKNWDWVVEQATALGEYLWEKMMMIANGIKDAFLYAWGMIKAVFMTYIDIILTIYGNAIKLIIKGLIKLGKLLDVDTAALEGVVDKIDKTQKKVREESFFNGNPASSQTSVIESRTTENNATVDVNVNAPKGTEVKSSNNTNNVKVNTGYQESGA